MSENISLKDLLDTTFTINDKGEMVGEFTIKRINMIGDILTNYYKEIERLKEEYMILQNASDEVEEEKDKEIERLNNIINDLLKRQNEALKYINNFLCMDNRYKHGNGNDELELVRKILNNHNQ